eukprot:4951970-Pyramimonas_sp.AAC.1
MSGNGIEWRPEPGEAHWRMGAIERSIETIKEIANRIAWELPDDTDPNEIFTWARAANNDLMCHKATVRSFMLMMGRTPSGQGLEDEENNSVLSTHLIDENFQDFTAVKNAACK